MNKSFKFSKFSPFWLISMWAVIILAGFIPVIPQPAVVVGYFWRVEFFLSGFILLTLVCALRFPFKKITLRRFDRREVYLVIMPLVLFAVWSGLSCIWAETWRNAAHHTLLWMCYGLFYLLVREIIYKPQLFNLSLTTTGIVVSVLGILCAIEYFTTAAENSVNVSLRYSKYAEIIAVLLPVFAAIAVGKKRHNSLFFGIVSIVGWFGIIFSLGRTQFLAGLTGIFILGIIGALYCRQKISLRKAAALAGLIFLTTGVSQISTAENARQTTFQRFSVDKDGQASFKIRFLFWGIALENLRQNPISGVGADNFISGYDTARRDYSEKNPEDSQLVFYENILPERTHNEFLQILSELGMTGGVLLVWLLFGVGLLAFEARKKSNALPTIGALAGITAFLVSSLASSYSFRVPANGLCFFFLLAVAVKGLLKPKDNCKMAEHQLNFNFSPSQSTFVLAGIIICVSMVIFSTVRGLSLMYLQKALQSSTPTEIEENYRKAIVFDEEEGLIRYYLALRLYESGRGEESIPQMRFAINRGICTSISYFYLAAAQIDARKNDDAERTLLESLRIYPKSAFLRTFYAVFLKDNGRHIESQIEYEKALQGNFIQAQSWWMVQTVGMKKLNSAANGDANLVTAPDLYPSDGAYALLDFQRRYNPKLLER